MWGAMIGRWDGECVYVVCLCGVGMRERHDDECVRVRFGVDEQDFFPSFVLAKSSGSSSH